MGQPPTIRVSGRRRLLRSRLTTQAHAVAPREDRSPMGGRVCEESVPCALVEHRGGIVLQAAQEVLHTTLFAAAHVPSALGRRVKHSP